jgi:hypothetical protein
MQETKGIWLEFDEERIFLETALIGGVLGDSTKFPMGMYGGTLQIEKIGVALLHSLRAIIRITREHHKMDITDSVEFICFCLNEAIEKEQANLNKEDSISTHEYQALKQMTKDYL